MTEIPISNYIWDGKYRLKAADGTPIDKTIEHTWIRVAKALAAAEECPTEWEHQFYSALEDFRFMPAGRIIAGAGTDRSVTLFNCYVMGTIPDSMDGIFAALREAALTLQQGGGIGYDFSTIRPRGAPVKGVAADASGPLSFMDVWDSMCRTIMSAGSRRGAMMATLRCDHPDIEAFIEAKRDPKRLRMFNLSVLCTDAFMSAVADNQPWSLTFEGRTFRTVSARELWNKIMRATYDVAEPGVIFIDRINDRNPLQGVEVIAATNPCGEQPLPPYGACLLGSLNLARLVRDPYQLAAYIDTAELRALTATAVRMLDNAITVSRFPLEAQRDEAYAKRRIGLGVTGLADALMMCGFRYGSDSAIFQTNEWLREIETAALDASLALGKEKGAFPLATRINSRRRNSHLTSIAPTGTISLFAGNVSSGIEPIFAAEYERKILEPDGSHRVEQVLDYGVKVWRDLGNEGLPPAYIDAQSLPPAAHVDMQAEAQQFVDSAISKTINLPEDISFEDFKSVYIQAYDSNCKGCTTYRPNAVTGSVIAVAPKIEKIEGVTQELPVRPGVLPAQVYKIKLGEHALYVTITDIEDGPRRRPFEIFISSKNPAHHAWTVALTRMLSAIFRRPHDCTFVVEELRAVHDPAGGGWWNGRYWPSEVAVVGQVIEDHMRSIGYLGTPASVAASTPCPKCFSTNTKVESGCLVCKDCGHSSCG